MNHRLPIDVHWQSTHYGVPVDYELWFDNQERRVILAGNGAEIDNIVRWRLAIQHAGDALIGAMTRLGPTMPAI